MNPSFPDVCMHTFHSTGNYLLKLNIDAALHILYNLSNLTLFCHLKHMKDKFSAKFEASCTSLKILNQQS